MRTRSSWHLSMMAVLGVFACGGIATSTHETDGERHSPDPGSNDGATMSTGARPSFGGSPEPQREPLGRAATAGGASGGFGSSTGGFGWGGQVVSTGGAPGDSCETDWEVGPHIPACGLPLGSLCSTTPSAYLKPLITGNKDEYGSSVAVSGDIMVVGARREDGVAIVDGKEVLLPRVGVAHVFAQVAGNWEWQATLRASNAETSDRFGESVAVSGDTIVVGARDEDGGDSGVNGDEGDNSVRSSGAAYVFVKVGGIWSQQAYLKASNPGEVDRFGEHVAISGDAIVVAAPREDGMSSGVNGAQDDGSFDAGAAYVFQRSGGEWTQTAYLKSFESDEGDSFGTSVAVSGDAIVVGATLEDSKSTGVDADPEDNSGRQVGAAYVYRRVAGTWTEEAYLKPEVANDGDYFGDSVTISGETIVVGASRESSGTQGINGNANDTSAQGSGAAYVFVHDSGSWKQQAYIKASNAEQWDYFGDRVALSGDVLVVSATGEDSGSVEVDSDQDNNELSGAGAVYVFRRDRETWTQAAYLKSPERLDLRWPQRHDFHSWGKALAIDRDTILVGGRRSAVVPTGVGRGEAHFPVWGVAHLFERKNDVWSPSPRLEPSPTSRPRAPYGYSGLGRSLAISGRTLVAGSVNAGVWQVYALGADGWEPEAWLAPRAEDSGLLHFESTSLGIRDDLIAAGSWRAKDSKGLVHLFARQSGVWARQALLESSNNDADDEFGVAVAVAENFIVVGAPAEKSAAGINGDASDNSLLRAGAAYVFERVDGTWTQTTYLKPTAVQEEEQFGLAVAAQGDSIAVASRKRLTTFVRSGGTWVERQSLPHESSPGASLAMSGDALVVGYHGVDVYRRRSCDLWDHEAKISTEDQIASRFGRSVSVFRDILAVGAHEEGNGDGGSVYLFARDDETGTWNETTRVSGLSPQPYHAFGYSVALDGDTLAVGDPMEDSSGLGIGTDPTSNAGKDSGAVFAWSVSN